MHMALVYCIFALGILGLPRTVEGEEVLEFKGERRFRMLSSQGVWAELMGDSHKIELELVSPGRRRQRSDCKGASESDSWEEK